MRLWILWARLGGRVEAKVVETSYDNDGCLSSVYEQRRESALWGLERWRRKRTMKAEEELNLQKRREAWQLFEVECVGYLRFEVECVGYLSFEVYHPRVPVPSVQSFLV